MRTATANNGTVDTNYGGADQVVQYVKIHDNLTLYDKLVKERAQRL